MNLGWLQDRRMRFVAKTLPSILYFVSIFVGLAVQLGYIAATLIAIVGALILWAVANRVVEKVASLVVRRIGVYCSRYPLYLQGDIIHAFLRNFSNSPARVGKIAG